MFSAKITTKRDYKLSIDDFSLLFFRHTDNENKQRGGIDNGGPR
jgi:hypothetical protein